RSQRESEAWLTLVVDSIPSLISFIGANQRYVLGNRAYRDWLGIDPATLPGRTVREVLGEENYAHLLHQLDRVLAPASARYTVPFRFSGGRLGTIEVLNVPYRALDGRVVGFVALAHDVTEQKSLEAAREALLACEQAAREGAERFARTEAKLREFEQQLL